MCLPLEDTLRQALETIKYHGYSAVPILNDKGQYIGTLTEGDILWAMEEQCHWNLQEAEKLMLKDIRRRRDNQAVSIDTDMDDLVEIIKDQNFVPVVDDQKSFIGIVTRKDVIEFYYNEHKNIKEQE